MENTIKASTNDSSNTVVSPDTKLNIQGLKTTYAYIDQLVIERQVWEDNAFRTSNEQLYALLQKCYRLYKEMGAETPEAESLRKGLEDYINFKGYTFLKTSHTLSKIVKCVFGTNRRRVSAYSIALRVALDEGVEVQNLPAYIRDAGGIEEVRREKNDASNDSAKQKRDIAAADANATSLGVATGAGLHAKLDSGKIGSQVVLIGSWQANGSIAIHAVVEGSSALQATLSSYYSENKSKLMSIASERVAANDAKATQDAIKEAANQALIKEVERKAA